MTRTLTKAQAKADFEDWAAGHIADLSPATLRTAWNDYTDSLSKDGVPKAYHWTQPRVFTIAGRKYRTQ